MHQMAEELKNKMKHELMEAGSCFLKKPTEQLNNNIYMLLKNIRYLNELFDNDDNEMEGRKKNLWG